MAEKAIPLLPCQTIQPVVDFYAALGFEVTFLQKSPNPFAVVERGDIELQFFAMKKYEPSESYSTCYVLTDDVDGLYEAFRAGLESAYGKIPSRGLPRMGPLKDMSYGVRQFLMTDPGGNCVRVGQPISEDLHHRPPPRSPSRGRCTTPRCSPTPRRIQQARRRSSIGCSDSRTSSPHPHSSSASSSCAATSPVGSATRRRRWPRWRGPPGSNSPMRNGSRFATTWRD